MNTLPMAAREESFEGGGGLNIFVRVWRPTLPPRGTLVIVHGFNSHSGQYAEAAQQFSAAGLAVYALDLRGRGRSDGERFYVAQFADYVDDVALLVKLARSREPALPVFMLGHSAGGVVACLYALEHQAGLAGLVCESFAFQLPAPDFALAVLKGLSHIAPCEDRATKPSGSRLFHDLAGSTDKTLTIYEGHFHDLLRDLGKELVMADINAWIDARIAREHDVRSNPIPFPVKE